MLKSKKFLSFLLFLCSFPLPCYAFQTRIVEVPDGDLVTVSMENTTRKIRLYGIMSPARGQPFHEKARILTYALTLRRNVEVTDVFRGSDGVMNALVRVEGNKDNLNLQLIAHGMAWVKPNECSATMCAEFKARELLAKINSVGLWADPTPIPPWEWEKQRRLKLKGSQD